MHKMLMIPIKKPAKRKLRISTGKATQIYTLHGKVRRKVRKHIWSKEVQQKRDKGTYFIRQTLEVNKTEEKERKKNVAGSRDSSCVWPILVRVRLVLCELYH